MSERDGGPAFPTGRFPEDKAVDPGASLRDLFAGIALQGLLACEVLRADDGSCSWIDVRNIPASFAKRSYEYADAMLAERQKATDGTTA